jgi:hypothetical protein
MGGCLFALALLSFAIGVFQLFVPDKGSAVKVPGLPRRFTVTPKPADSSGPAFSSPSVNMETPSMDSPDLFNSIRIGDRVRVKYPQMGELNLHVLGQVDFAELWQTSRSAQSPWVPTGNRFTGFWLETNVLLLNWLTRFYILDEFTPVTDVDIQRDFSAHARKFAQSEQTADVYFAYPPAMWHIDDIGKFKVEAVEGEGIRTRPGATGRFVHASGDSDRALILEDYEGGGGADAVWTGYKIQQGDIQKS